MCVIAKLALKGLERASEALEMTLARDGEPRLQEFGEK